MKSGFENRWLAAAVIWIVAMVLTYWNYDKIGAVAAVRETNERHRNEIRFQRQHAQKLAQVANSRDALFLRAASAQLGFVAVRSDLGALAAAFDLQDFVIGTEMTQSADEQLACHLSLRGGFKKTVQFLDALDRYRYLHIKRTRIKVSMGRSEVLLEMALDLHFKISTAAETTDTPLQVTTPQPSRGTNPL